jgi:glycosyltransferase involved in cell wall biosynthesis
MNILFLNKDGLLGGSAISLLLLIDGLRNYGISNKNIKLIIGERGELETELKKRNIQYYVFPFKRWRAYSYRLYNYFIAYKLSRFLKSNHFDIIHSNTYELSPFLSIALNRKERKKTIIHIRDYISYKRAKKFCVHKFSNIISVSKSVASYILPIKSVVVYDSIDIKKITSAKGGKINKKHRDILFGVVGFIEEGKNQAEFLEAFKKAYSSNPNIKAYIIGDTYSKYSEVLKERYKELIGKSVFFIPYKRDIYDYIKDLDVVVISSKSESFGRTVIEGNAMKKPVIASNIPGINEIVKDGVNGFLYQLGNIDDLASKMLFLANNETKRNELGFKGYDMVLKNFTNDIYVKRILEIYHSLNADAS